MLKADPEAYLRLSRQRDARVRLRVWVTGVTVTGALAVVAVAVASGGLLPRRAPGP